MRWEGLDLEELRDRWQVPALEVWDRIGSTSDRLREWADQGAPAWSVVLAEVQSAGRGREGRTWHSPQGGVWLSVLAPALQDGRPASLLAGLVTARAIARVAGVSPGLKWPNDVWLDERKVAGILCETTPGAPVRVGIGINVAQAPGELPADVRALATSLEEAGTTVSRVELVGELLDGLRETWSERGSTWLREWESRDALRGRAVRAASGPVGIAEGVDAHGRLRIRVAPGQVEYVASGSVRLELADATLQPSE
ncbi:MAG: biotin--[acetyl-CoA-carboxylase] ligase [Gemmatimonadota bacterium]